MAAVDIKHGLPSRSLSPSILGQTIGRGKTLKQFLQECCTYFPEYGAYGTFHYEFLAFMPENREIDPARSAALAKSFKEDGYFMPILKVNEKLQIIDGQHRFDGARSIMYPVYFQIYPYWGINEVLTLNVRQKQWDMDDYLHSYVVRSFKPYLLFKQFIETFGVTANLGLELANNADRSAENILSFKMGTFHFDQKRFSSSSVIAAHIQELGEFHPLGSKKVYFIRAVKFMLRQAGYDQKRMLKQLRELPDEGRILKDARTLSIESYLREFQKVYNKNLRNQNRIDFYDIYMDIQRK